MVVAGTPFPERNSDRDTGSRMHPKIEDFRELLSFVEIIQGASGTLPGASGGAKNIKNQKNHQFQFLRLLSIDKLNRLVTSPRFENITNRQKMHKNDSDF